MFHLPIVLDNIEKRSATKKVKLGNTVGTKREGKKNKEVKHF